MYAGAVASVSVWMPAGAVGPFSYAFQSDGRNGATSMATLFRVLQAPRQAGAEDRDLIGRAACVGRRYDPDGPFAVAYC